jgi:hypothetical protein
MLRTNAIAPAGRGGTQAHVGGHVEATLEDLRSGHSVALGQQRTAFVPGGLPNRPALLLLGALTRGPLAHNQGVRTVSDGLSGVNGGPSWAALRRQRPARAAPQRPAAGARAA